MNKLPLLELFTSLQENGRLPLGVGDYQALLKALEAGFGIKDRDSLAQLCCALWIKSAEEKRIFNYHFDRLIPKEATEETKTLPPDPPSSKLKLYLILGGTFIFIVIFGFIINLFKKIREILMSVPLPSEGTIYLLLIFVIPFLFAYRCTLRMKRSKLRLYLILGEMFIFGVILVVIINYFQISPPETSDLPPFRLNKKIIEIIEIIERILVLIIPLFFICVYILFMLAVVKVGLWINKIGVRSKTGVRSIGSPNKEPRDEGEDNTQIGTTEVPDVNTKDTFNPIAAYFPTNRREMKQSWSYLRCLVKGGAAVELDLIGTIKEIGRYGIFLNPVLVPRRTNRTELLLLIDQDGSMVPFHTISRFLVETALQEGSFCRACVYYFHNCPTEYFYQDEARSLNEDIDTVLNQLNQLHTVALIFSDAGAVRRRFNKERYDLTSIFLKRIKRKIRYIAWVNPMPKERWVNTTAQEIAYLIPMFEINRQGFDSAINALRGHHSNQ